MRRDRNRLQLVPGQNQSSEFSEFIKHSMRERLELVIIQIQICETGKFVKHSTGERLQLVPTEQHSVQFVCDEIKG